MRLLVVDDDPVFREELSDLLREDGHAVAMSPSVPKAIEELERAEVDVVLTDLKMPRGGGLELLREVRARWPRSMVVVVTGFASVETALEAMKLGAFDYVRKPFRLEQVRETLRLAELERAYDAPPKSERDPVREAESLAASGKFEVLFVGEPAPPPGPHLTLQRLDPEGPASFAPLAESFLAEHPNGAIVLVGVERWLRAHRLEDVLATIDRVRLALVGHGPFRVGFNPHRVTRAAAAALGGAVASEETHATLEALANPIRRQVLQRVADGPAPFGELMRAAGLDESPKMSFHLRKLVESGLLLHEEDRYRLTARGEATVRLLHDAAFLPVANEAGNRAFAGRSGGGGTKSRTGERPS